MIFVGDIASPAPETTESLTKVISDEDGVFWNKRIVCNLEGLISEDIKLESNEPFLFNHPAVLDAIDTGQNPVICLANNHILDCPSEYNHTIELLEDNGIQYCGAGRSDREAGNPAFFKDGVHEIAIFNSCWDFLMYNHKNPFHGVYVSELKEENLIRKITKLKTASPKTSLVVYLHWNLDLEVLPFPMHRVFARDLIDAGASVVIGSHSHCIQGGEKYKEGYIIYGLGNFFVPHNIFISGKLNYPDFASTELALEWDPDTSEATCHWYKYALTDSEHRLIHIISEKFERSAMLNKYSPYKGMSDQEYLRYFKSNRRKKVLIPVYKDYRKKNVNNIHTRFLRIRARSARRLARLGIIKWQN